MGMDINSTLSEQIRVLGEDITLEKVAAFDVSRHSHALNIFTVNVGVSVIFFILSFFYGAGAIFLIVWNASIFSTFVFTTLQNIGRGVQNSLAMFGVFSLYIVPEIAGFLLAGIAGGVISKALVTEKFMSDEFRNVVKDAMVLLLVSFGVLFVAALLESYVAVNVIKSLI